MARRISLLVLMVLLSVGLTSGQEADHLAAAQKLLQAGEFREAEAEFRDVLTRDGKNFEAFRDIGIICVLGNRLEVAVEFLQQAAALNAKDAITKAYLAEAYYRQKDFAHAAPIFRTLGAEQAAVKLESFKDTKPYLIEGDAHATTTTLKFVTTDPLPVVTARVNNSDAVNFLIDTGGGELILDPEFARSVGAREFGEVGSPANQGRIDSLKLGDFTIRNIPISILDTKRFSVAADGRKIDGIIGTVVLYQFLTTLDYPNDQLILERRATNPALRAAPPSKGGEITTTAFWMAGDHFLVTWAEVNNIKEMVLVDTGLAGVGFTCPESTLKEIDVGVGSSEGGKPVPFVVNDLALDGASGHKVRSFLGPFPAGLETRFGFRVGGLISHEFFRNYALTLDFDAMQLRLKKP